MGAQIPKLAMHQAVAKVNLDVALQTHLNIPSKMQVIK